MARSTRKPPTATRSKKPETNEDNMTTSDPAVPVTEADTEQDPVANLTIAYQDALDERDTATGVIPAVPLDVVKTAYRQVAKRQRGNLVAKLAGQAGRNVTRDDGQLDTGLAVAVATLSGVFAQLNEQDRPTRPPHDPVPGLAGILAALDKARADILGELSDEQRERIAQVDTQDPPALTMAESATAALDKFKARAINGRSRRNGPRSPASDTEAALRAVVTDALGPVTFTEITEQTGISASTLWSRWQTNKTPGVLAVTDDQGNKAFQAAR